MIDSSRMDNLRDRLATIRGQHTVRVSAHAKAREEHLALSASAHVMSKVHAMLGVLMRNTAQSDMDEMNRLVTHGIRTVFSGIDLEFKASVEDTGKRISINLKTLKSGMEVADDAKGSVTVVQSLLLRMLCILKLEKPKLVLLDETFGAIDAKYIDAVGPLVSDLCSKMGFDILLVTHNPGASDTHVLLAALNGKNELSVSRKDLK